MSYRKSFLIRSEILELLVTKLTANCEYSRSNTDKLPLPVQMHLSEKLETMFGIFIAFLKSALNFEHFFEKITFMGQVSLMLMTPKDVFT